MEEEYFTIDKEYLKDFNTGYTLSEETGLKPEVLEKLSPEKLKSMGINYISLAAIKQGMKQFEKDKELGLTKSKDVEKQKQGLGDIVKQINRERNVNDHQKGRDIKR